MYETCPACGTRTVDAPGIGPCCPNKKCDSIDDLRPESERTPVRIVTPNKSLAERLRYMSRVADSFRFSLHGESVSALLTEAADALENQPRGNKCNRCGKFVEGEPFAGVFYCSIECAD